MYKVVLVRNLATLTVLFQWPLNILKEEKSSLKSRFLNSNAMQSEFISVNYKWSMDYGGTTVF
jgi:16S rRNA G527 N7-methylase RsmG